MHGRGDLVRIDLNTGSISKEPIPTELCNKFLGGEGINAWLLWEHFLKVNPKIDPLSPDNVLIFGIGPLASTGLGAGSKAKFTFKSPTYNIYGDTSVGGGFGSQLRWAGHDHMVVTGRARHPVYIWVNNDSIEIRDARHLWGKDVSTTDALIKEELGDEEIETACIGRAGEKLVRFASIMVSCHRAGGRGGGGCVFGSKNLKAMAARGTKGLNIHNPGLLLEAVKDFRDYKERDPADALYSKYGTISIVRSMHKTGFLAYRNCQGRMVPEEQVARIDHNWYVNNLGVRTSACSPGCAFACGGWYQIKGDESPGAKMHAGEWGPKPEFGSINPFANACDLPDLPEVCHLNNMCNEYGMDVMETAMEIAFLMELWERGIITPDDTEKWAGKPLSLEWGNFKAMERIIDDIATRNSELGELLSGGVYQTALKIESVKNVPARRYALYGKAGATHEAQGRLPSSGLYMSVASVGAHHTKGSGIGPALAEKFLGTAQCGKTDMLFGQGESKGWDPSNGAGQAISEYLMGITNSLGVCMFLNARKTSREVPLEVQSKALLAVTGVKMSPEDLMTAGQRVVNMEKAFNSRLGLRREDDTVCHRWMNEPLKEGLAKGTKLIDFLDPLKDVYYEYHGWDKKMSLQTKKKLEELNMGDVAQILCEEGALSSSAKGA